MANGNAALENTVKPGGDVLYITDRCHSTFSYPIHNHAVCELNFVERALGARRIVGDSREVIGEYDLVLITDSRLEHVWEQHQCTGNDIREVTVQFDFDFIHDDFFFRKPYAGIREMLEKARCGLSFPLPAIMKVYALLDTLSSVKDSFYAVGQFLSILYELSKAENVRVLSSRPDARSEVNGEGQAVWEIKEYMAKHYAEDVRLADLAAKRGMSVSAFSRFFKKQTGVTLIDYLIDVRVESACRMLVDTAMGISSISTACGFRNLSNFNRVFRRRKGTSPSEYRDARRKARRAF